MVVTIGVSKVISYIIYEVITCPVAIYFCDYEVIMYRLHHEVEVSTEFTHRGPEARGCINRVETEPSDVTDLYHGLRGPDNESTA